MASASYQARALFHAGHYARARDACLAAAPHTGDSELLYLAVRALLALGDAASASRVLDAAPSTTEFAVLRTAATAAASGNPASAAGAIREMMGDPAKAGNQRTAVVAADWLLAIGDIEGAVAAAGPLVHDENLEAATLLLHVYTRLGRADLAQKLHDRTRAWSSDDTVLTQLAEVLASLADGRDARVREAIWSLDELVQTFAASPLLLTMLGVCHLRLGALDDALACLGEAIPVVGSDATRTGGDALANLGAALAASGQDSTAILDRLRAEYPTHPMAIALESKRQQFAAASALKW